MAHKERFMILSNQAAYHGFAHLKQTRDEIKLRGLIIETTDNENVLEFDFAIKMTERGPRLLCKYKDSNGTRWFELDPEATEPTLAHFEGDYDKLPGHNPQLSPAAGEMK